MSCGPRRSNRRRDIFEVPKVLFLRPSATPPQPDGFTQRTKPLPNRISRIPEQLILAMRVKLRVRAEVNRIAVQMFRVGRPAHAFREIRLVLSECPARVDDDDLDMRFDAPREELDGERSEAWRQVIERAAHFVPPKK